MNLPADVTLLVLLAALMHASWNGIVKSSRSTFLDTVMITVVPGAIGFVAIMFLPLPARACWPWLAASVAIHFLYYMAVAGAYRHGDLSHVYPIMRGCAPLLVALASFAGLGDPLSSSMWVGVVLISAGIIAPALIGARVGIPGRGTQIAAVNAVIIASYTIVDGIGTRLSGNAVSYGQWMFFLDAIPLTLFALALRGRHEVRGYLRERWAMGIVGGVLSMASYAIVLWAMTRAPVAGVAALRETSVIFAAIIGTLLLRESFGAPRIIGAVLVAAGVAALKL